MANKKLKSKPPSKPSSSSHGLLSVIVAVLAVGYGIWKYAGPSLLNLGNDVDDGIYDKRILRDQTIFKVADIYGKGKGLRAIRDIQQGELIIREKPLILMPPEVSHDFLPKKLRSMTNSSYHAFASLSHGKLPDNNLFSVTESSDDQPHTELRDIATNTDLRDLALSILDTNGIVLNADLVGLFPRMARMNHACGGQGGFNAVYSWRPNYVGSGELFVRAMTEIRKGDEITIAYMDTRQKKEDRIKHLQDSYGFTCKCAVCSLQGPFSDESDRRLTKMAELEKEFATWKEGEITGRQALSIASHIMSLQQQQQYWSGRGKLADDACEIAASNADETVTSDWARVAMNWYRWELGEDHISYKRMVKVADDPKSHSEWGAKKEQSWNQ
ncbi:hypothetical protein DL96DRAFT_1620292 [Flagelloscypha sp. PMI_526]|nr:hypothetical protein DL96DRAFT_1620292 [Flagelloscypha sp. PMI_526]